MKSFVKVLVSTALTTLVFAACADTPEESNRAGAALGSGESMGDIANPISDFIVGPGAEDRVVDLASVFSGDNLIFSVESSNPEIVAVSLNGSQMTIDIGDILGHADLRITATDESGASVTDKVRARIASDSAYTIAVIPDTQVYTYSGELDQTFNRMTQWLADNQEAHRIQFAVHVGDLQQNNDNPVEWDIVTEAMSKLEGRVPYSILAGNHDGHGTNLDNNFWINRYFSAQQLAEANPDTFGGAYDEEPEGGANSYSTFTAPDGTKWLVLSLEFAARPDVLRWASEVVEDYLDHRVIFSTHMYTNYASRDNASSKFLYDNSGGTDLRTDLARMDGETMWREFVSKYPNISFVFSGHTYGDGGETVTSYNQHGQPVHQMLMNYQDGGAKEISGNGDSSMGGRGGQGLMRLLVIDPEAETVSTQSYFANFDEYLTGYRGSPELSRDGLTGFYREQQEVIESVYLGPPELFTMAKAGPDLRITAEPGAVNAQVTLDASATLNPRNDDGLRYVWTDADNHEIATGVEATVALAPGNHHLTLVVTDSKRRITTDSLRVVVSNDATLLVEDFNDGEAGGWTEGNRISVKNSTDNVETSSILGEDRLVDYSGTPDQAIVWTDPTALGWWNYVFQSTLHAHDDNGIGVVFYYQDAENHYRVVFDGRTNTRSLFKVREGVTTTLATQHLFAPFQQDMEVTVAVVDSEIRVFLDGHDIFGPVVDLEPLAGGTVGFYSNEAPRGGYLFDNVAVNPVRLTAHAGADWKPIDLDGDRRVSVLLTAQGSYGPEPIVDWSWTDAYGDVLATEAEAVVEIKAKPQTLTLTVTDETGAQATDDIFIDASAESRVLLAEDFANRAGLHRWTIVDEGELGGIGENGTQSQWELEDGALVQLSDLASRQLTFISASPEDVYTYLVGSRFWFIMLDGQNGIRPDPDGRQPLDYDWDNAQPDTLLEALKGYLTERGAGSEWDPALTEEIFSHLDQFFEEQASQLSWPEAIHGPVWDALFEWLSPVTWLSEWEGPDNVWERGWSPLGDGVNILRRGTYALYDARKAARWRNYAVEATIETPDNGALGFMFYYRDPDNYYKLELDADGDYDRNAENGAGSLFQFVEVVDGVESVIYQVPGKYTPGEAFHLRAEIVDGAMQAFVDGEAVFDYAIESRSHERGTVALYSWGSAGVSFDDLRVVHIGKGTKRRGISRGRRDRRQCNEGHYRRRGGARCTKSPNKRRARTRDLLHR